MTTTMSTMKKRRTPPPLLSHRVAAAETATETTTMMTLYFTPYPSVFSPPSFFSAPHLSPSESPSPLPAGQR